jgi:hypothetical protein
MKKVFFLILLIFALMPAKAQDEPDPLLEMLAQMPQSIDEAIPFIAYADIELALSAWEDLPEVNSLEDYEELSNTEREIYTYSMPRTIPRILTNVAYGQTFGEFSDSFGLNFFNIEQSLHRTDRSFEPYIAFRGVFDNEAIINSHLETGYSQRGEEWTVLCPETGCDEEYLARAISSPFDWDAAFILGENLLIQALSPDYLAASEAVLSRDAPSMLEIADYAASARLLTSSGDLSQVIFIQAQYIAEVNELMGVDSRSVEALPAYRLVSIAELVFPEDEVTEVNIILSYENAEDAEIAAENLEENLDNPDVFNAIFWERLDGNLDRVEVREDVESGLFLVQAVMSSPFQDAPDSIIGDSSLFNLVYKVNLDFLQMGYLLVED